MALFSGIPILVLALARQQSGEFAPVNVGHRLYWRHTRPCRALVWAVLIFRKMASDAEETTVLRLLVCRGTGFRQTKMRLLVVRFNTSNTPLIIKLHAHTHQRESHCWRSLQSPFTHQPHNSARTACKHPHRITATARKIIGGATIMTQSGNSPP